MTQNGPTWNPCQTLYVRTLKVSGGVTFSAGTFSGSRTCGDGPVHESAKNPAMVTAIGIEISRENNLIKLIFGTSPICSDRSFLVVIEFT